MSSQAASQDSRSAQDAKRRKRKERTAKNRAPEPKDIVSGAGQPLDLSVRRELEEQLGHDFGQVRLHTDRDAGVLTDMLGADAVAVGQDIFFREGTYRPGTADGRRLLAHELLHTVQNPHGLGALRAGRDLGAVSLPQQPMEREAESAAQESVRSAMRDSVREEEPAAEVEPGQATPGWLRYATVDADRQRMELIDPATLVDRLANGVLRSLRGDPEDRSRRARIQLARLPEELHDSVLERLEERLLSSEHERVLDLIDEIEADDDDLSQNSLDAPTVEPDSAEELRLRRETEQSAAEEQQERERSVPVAPGPEKEWSDPDGATGSTPQNGGTREENAGTPQGGSTGEQQPGGATGGSGGAPSGEQQSEASAAPSAAPQQEASAGAGESSRDQGASSEGKAEGGAGGEKKGAAEEDKEGTEQESAPAASEEESAAKNRPGAADALVAGQQLKQEDKGGQEKPTGSPTVSGKDTQLPGAFSTLEGVRGQDLDGPEEKSEEDPFGSGSRSEVEVGGGEKSAWDIKLQPEDFLPERDLDVSGVPTADELDPSSSAAATVPSFPAPPVTRADKVQAERDAEDAEDAAGEVEPEKDHTASSAVPEPSVETEGSGPGGEPGGLALEQAAAARSGAVPKDPKAGADPKDGPVAAQMTVQESPGRSEKNSGTEEQAAKEEKGTSAKGEGSGKNPEKATPEAVGGESARQDPAAKEDQGRTESAPAEGGGSEPATESQDASPARDTHVSGGSNADTPGGASSDAASGSQTDSSGSDGGSGQGEQGSPAAEAPAAKAAPAPAPAKAPAAAPAPKAAPAAKAEQPKASPAKSAPAGKGSRGGGGGGGGAPAKGKGKGKGKKDSGPAPNLSQVSPEAGLSTAAKLKPHKAMEAMGGVSGAVDRTVGDEHQQLAAAPPSMERPAGAPQTLQGKPKADGPAQYSQDPAQKSEAPKDEKAEVKGAKEPEGQIEAEKAEEPGGWDTFKMALGFGLGKVLSWVGFEVDASELAAKFAGLPTKDEALKKAQAGNAPGVEMQGAADRTAGEQGNAVDAKGEETVASGRDDAGRPMGEDQVYPNAPKEQMQAKVPGSKGGGKGGPPGGGTSTGVVPPEAASEVAEHDRGPQFQAAFSKGQKSMSEGRQAKDRDFRDSQQKHKQQVDTEVAKNTDSQAGERERAMSDVTAQREDWRKEQDEELKGLGTKKTERHDKVRKDVKDKEEKTDKDTEKEKEDGDKKIQDESTKAEKDAEKKRDSSVEDSGNWVSKAFDWLKEKVLEIKNAIVSVIKKAREAVVGFIKNFKETVERWINEARKFIVDTIKNLINDLIEFAKAMVRAVIELADRIRKFITDLIAAAIALVNKLANMLKQIITDLLNAIGKLLSSILEILKKALQDVLKAVVDAIKTVLDYASKLLAALGDFMLIAVDFLSDPGGWLGGAKNSAVDGAKNHLFQEVKSAVKEWFQSKIEEIIGIPKAIIDKLIKGGFTLEKIVKETWDAIVPMLPFIIGEIVITKVVAKLIPGAGWAMAVIDAIKVAIGALGEILRAIGAVITWLKAVRQGGAGILFAKAVAAGIVALLELAYEALLSGIGKYIGKVGKRLKGVAAKLGKDKGDKPGGDKDAGADGSDPKNNNKGKDKDKGAEDKGGDKKDQDRPGAPKTTPKTPDAPGSTRPTTTKPKPKSDTKPSTKPDSKPDGKPGPKKDTDKPGPKKEQVKTPSPPDKPKSTDKEGKPKTGKDDDRPATSPTPATKPKPKSDPETKPKPKDETPDKPKTDKDDNSTKPKDDDTSPAKPKDRDRDGPGKTKDLDSRKQKPDSDKPGPGRPKSDQEKDKRKEEEEESKEDRLRKIVARIRPRLEKRLREGIPSASHAVLLGEFRRWYRLTGLFKQGGENFSVRATLNPEAEAADGVTENGTDRDKPLEFPTTDSRSRFVDGVEPKSFKHDFINKKWAKGGEYPPSGDGRLNIIGFRHLRPTDENDTDLSEPRGYFQWDAMHLLPRELGGPAAGSNYVPAYNHINKGFYNSFENQAANTFGSISKGEKPGYYEIVLSLHEGSADQYPDKVYPKGFPKTLQAKWATYEHKGAGTGENRSEWKAEEEVASPVLSNFPEPPTEKRPLVDLNNERDAVSIRAAFAGTNDELLLAVFKLRPFNSVQEMQDKLKDYIAKKTGKSLETKYVNRMKNNHNRIFKLD